MAAFLCCKEIDKKLGLDLFVDCYFRQIVAMPISALEGTDFQIYVWRLVPFVLPFTYGYQSL